MKTIEDFIKGQLNTERLTPLQWDGIRRAMEVYAEQQALEFGEWMFDEVDDHLHSSKDGGYNYYDPKVRDGDPLHFQTTSDLYKYWKDNIKKEEPK